MVFIHSSDELYGADRMLLAMLEALPPEVRERAEFWLPTDQEHPSTPLCRELELRGATVRHLDLPILRRAYRRPVQLARLVGRMARLGGQLRSTRPSLVYCTTSATYLASPVAALLRIPRRVGHVQEIWAGGDRAILGRLARPFDTLLAISRPVAESMPPALAERTTVVLNGSPDPGPPTTWPGRDGELGFVVASRWNAWKGHRTLLAAWDRLEGPGRLVVLGGAPTAGEAVDVPALVRSLRRPETVEVVGEVEDPHTYLESADVVVVPSDNPEPFGLVAIEAFARGRPVIGSDAGGLADIVDHGETGWLYPAGDAEALAEVIAGLTPDQVQEAGRRARDTYESKFTTARFGLDWISALDFRR